MPTIEDNRFWNDYSWEEHGDEWGNQSAYCNQPYDEWFDSIVEKFINSNVNSDSTVLEIGPGHGRWTENILKKARKVVLVDLNPGCIEFCKKKFSAHNGVEYHVNDGKGLGFIEDCSIDFIWSYDSFVHMEKDVIESYFKEFSRVLRVGGKALIHHPGRRHIMLKLKLVKRLGGVGRSIYRIMSMGRISSDGWRSDVSKEMIRDIAAKNNLSVGYQVDSWGEKGRYNCRLFNDYVSELIKNKPCGINEDERED